MKKFLDLGLQPLANSYLDKKNLNKREKKFRLEVSFNPKNYLVSIQNTVSNYFNIALSEMLSQRRSRPLARPRQIAMYLAKSITSRSLPEIGRKFGGRDHTTVMHAVKKIEELKLSDVNFNEDLELLKRLIDS